jgi:rhodanese-related sulfurtransferase
MPDVDSRLPGDGGPSGSPLEVSVADAARLLGAPPPGGMAPLLLDCRTPEEHATARIAGAMLVPMQELPERLAELEAFRPATVVVHCHHGMRSLKVARWLRDRGFSRAVSMRGGIEAWSLEIDPAVPRY